jgi:site-specific recombinase XerD
MVHIHRGKGRKDRFVPMGTMLQRAIKSYLQAEKPGYTYSKAMIAICTLCGVELDELFHRQ